MKRIWPIAVLSVLVAAPIAASGDPGAPTADLKVTPATVTEGDTVTLDASASQDDGAIAGYAFDADGDGSFEPAGTQSSVQRTLSTRGEVRLGVRVVDDTGLSSDAFQSVTVAPKPQPKEVAAAPEPAAEPAAEPAPEPAAEPKPKKVESKSAPEPEPEPAAEPEPARKDTTVRAAASATVSIRDFSFAPRSVTVNVGDSVTWTNAGPTDHTATASDGSFDTGTLSKGRSASHTFAKAGTFAYVCSIHPNMHGSVKVVASSGGGGSSNSGTQGGGSAGSSGAGSSSSSGTTAAPSGSSGSLPATGMDAGGLALVGAGFLALGLFARRRTTS